MSEKLDIKIEASTESFSDRIAAINSAMSSMGVGLKDACKAAAAVGQACSQLGVSFSSFASIAMRHERENIELQALAKILDGDDDDNAETETHKPTRIIRLPDD